MSHSTDNIGLLVMHYGTPASTEAILPYYTHIRRGRPPTQELLDDLVYRYSMIGGPSPLTEMSERQAAEIQAGLKRRGVEAKLYIGTKHAPPFVADAVQQMAEDGIDRAVGVVLAPHFSSYSVAAYRKYAFDAREAYRPEMQIGVLERWGTLPAFVDGLASRVLVQLEGLELSETLVIFSAHSLPEKIVAGGDPYKDELLETSQLVADKLKLPNWTFAFQSASQTGEPWLGPDILEVIEREAPNYKNITSCTVGFLCDHLEVKFDLGIEARDKCAELGVKFRLASTIGADPAVMDAVAGLAFQQLTS